MAPEHHHSQRLKPSVTGFVDASRIEALLLPWIPDAHDRAFVTRCVLEEGPVHHRGSNFVLLSLLARLLEGLGSVQVPAAEDSAPVPLKLPPHLHAKNPHNQFPLRLPLRALDLLAPRGSLQQQAMLDCLTDGPPQHSLANAAMLCVLDAVLARTRPSAGSP